MCPPPAADIPPTWHPPDASTQAKAMWDESPWTRARKLFRPNPRILDTYMPLLLESFTYEQFQVAIVRHYNVLPEVEKKGLLNHPFWGQLGMRVIRIQWPYIFDGLTNPRVVLEKIRRSDPRKASLFDHGEGWVYFTWMTFHLLWMLYYRGKIKGEIRVEPPTTVCPLHQGLCVKQSPAQP